MYSYINYRTSISLLNVFVHFLILTENHNKKFSFNFLVECIRTLSLFSIYIVLKIVHKLIGIYRVHEGFPEQAIPANEQYLNILISMGLVGLSLVLPPVLIELHCL